MASQPPPRRPSTSGAPGPSGPKGSGGDDRQALLRAFQDVVKEDHDRRTGAPPPLAGPASRAPFWITMMLLAGVLAGLLITQPRWLFPRPPAESPALKEASLRVRMYVEIERIEQFRSANGRLPGSLLEARGDTTGVQYSPGAEGYSLTGRAGGVSLTYASSQSPQEFVGNSYELVRRRGQP